MTVQNEVRWLIETLIAEWPTTGSLGGTAPPDTVLFRDRDEPVSYYREEGANDPDAPTDYEAERELAAPTDGWRTVAVATGASTRSFYGNKPQYRVETTLDVRVQEKTAYEGGVVDSVGAHNTLVAVVQEAINADLTYPAVDTGDEDIGRIVYEDLAIVDTDHRSREFKDQYRTDFTVRLRGFQDTPEQ